MKTSHVSVVLGLGAALAIGAITPAAAAPSVPAPLVASGGHIETGLTDVQYRRHWRGGYRHWRPGWRGYGWRGGYRPWRYGHRPYRYRPFYPY